MGNLPLDDEDGQPRKLLEFHLEFHGDPLNNITAIFHCIANWFMRCNPTVYRNNERMASSIARWNAGILGP